MAQRSGYDPTVALGHNLFEGAPLEQLGMGGSDVTSPSQPDGDVTARWEKKEPPPPLETLHKVSLSKGMCLQTPKPYTRNPHKAGIRLQG